MHAYNFFVNEPNFTKFILLNLARIVVDEVCFTFLLSRSFAKIFAVKVKNCPKLGWIFDFWPSQIIGVQTP